jgi:hypothetical protein
MGLSSFLKNLFGSAKETASELADKAELAVEQAKETAMPYLEKAEAFAEETFEQAKEASEPLIEKAESFSAEAKEVVSDYADKASDALGDVIKNVKESTSHEKINKAEEGTD